jgi:hypothetical protein
MSTTLTATYEPATCRSLDQPLPSGRSVIVKVAEGREELEVRSPEGDVEVVITLTEAGPVVRLRAARLEMEAAETLSLSCRRLDVHTTEETAFHSEGKVQITGTEMRVRTEEDIHLNGAFIRLNCEEPG